MTQEEILKGNKLIDEFMGAKLITDDPNFMGGNVPFFRLAKFNDIERNYTKYELKYHSSWDWIMPVCYKWDNLFEGTAIEYPKAMEYEKLCDEIDNAVSRYEILPVFNQLVENIKWFNQNK